MILATTISFYTPLDTTFYIPLRTLMYLVISLSISIDDPSVPAIVVKQSTSPESRMQRMCILQRVLLVEHTHHYISREKS